jgi:pimeloyl-ACP methyl ester carboxylesterase
MVVAGLCIWLGGCAADWEPGDEHFVVTHQGASTPVWVTGNWRSNRIVVHVHGGPGSTNMIYYQKESYQRLADDVGVVYFEQRASGATLGAHREFSHIDQWVEDVDVVMTVLEDRYPEAEFVLMGHSFGGHLGPKFLFENQDRFLGWIEQSGEHDASCRVWEYAKDTSLAIGATQVAASPEDEDLAEFWADAERFYEDDWLCNVQTNENNLNQEVDGVQVQLRHAEIVRAAGGYDVVPERVLNGPETVELLFRSQFDPFAVLQHMPYPMEGLFGVDLTPRFGEITLPTLVLWGRHDLATPAIQAEPGLAAYGAPAEAKRLVWFEDSGHNPWAEEPEKFYAEVRAFLDEVWPGEL